jgi:hypothetical protein
MQQDHSPEPEATGAYSVAKQESAAASSRQTSSGQEGQQALLPGDEAQAFWARWQDLQAGFVDSPRQALERANVLVDEVMKRLTETFSEEKKGLESQWASGGDVTTEEMRVVLQHYRSFFERLLLTSSVSQEA